MEQPGGMRVEPNAAGTAVLPRVLCAVDGKDGGFAAVEQAASLAADGGSLTVLVVTSFRSLGEYRSPAIGPLRAKSIADRARAIAETAGVEATVEVEPATPPSRVVLGWAAEHDLLALGAPATSWLGGLLIAGVADTAIGSFVTPLLAARPAAGPPWAHVLVASDGLEDSEVPLALAGDIARRHGSRLTLLHAMVPAHRDRRDRVLDQGERLELPPSREPDVLFRRGGAHHVIVESASRLGASLVVVGSRRRGGPRAIGSVSRRVVHDAPCSVLLVPPALAAGPPGAPGA